MARNGSGVYSLPAGSTVSNGDTSDATDINTPLADLETDMNTPRPIVAGGTGASSASAARSNLGLERLDEDDMASDSATAVATQQSIKAYVDGAASIRYIDSVTITSSTGSAAKAIPSDYKSIVIKFYDFEPVTSGAFLSMRIGVNAAAGPFTFGASDYTDHALSLAGTSVSGAPTDRSAFPLTGDIRNSAAADRGFGEAKLIGLNTASTLVRGHSESGGINNSGTRTLIRRDLYHNAAGDYDGVQFFASSGNIGRLTLHIYGVRNA